MEKLFSKTKAFSFNRLANERGMAFVTTILLLIVLALLIAASTKWSAQDIKRTANYTKSRDSFYTAETGIHRALNWLNYDPATGECRERGTDGYNAELLAQSIGGDTAWPDSLFEHPSNGFYNEGYYDVTIANNPDGGDAVTDLDRAVMLTSRGVKRGMPTTVEALVHRGVLEIEGGLITNGHLKYSGNAKLLGSGGTAHSNTSLDENGIEAEQAAGGTTATQDGSGTGCLDSTPETCTNITEEKEVPFATLSQFGHLAHFILKRDSSGNDQVIVRDTTTVSHDDGTYQSFQTCTLDTSSYPPCVPGDEAATCPTVCQECWKKLSSTGTASGATCDQILDASVPLDTNGMNDRDFNTSWAGLAPDPSATVPSDGLIWKIQGVVPDGVFLIPDDASLVVQDTGPSTHFWNASILVDGNLDIRGNSQIDNYIGGVDSGGEGENLLFFTVGRDLRINANTTLGSGSGTRGWITVHDQFDIKGTMTLNGYILAKDACVSNNGGNASAETAAGHDLGDCPGQKGYTSYNDFGGTATITYDKDFPPNCPSCKATITTWREITGAG